MENEIFQAVVCIRLDIHSWGRSVDMDIPKNIWRLNDGVNLQSMGMWTRATHQPNCLARSQIIANLLLKTRETFKLKERFKD